MAIWTPEQPARNPVKVKGGWLFTVPPKSLWRYNAHARRQMIAEWAKWGGLAIASIVGGAFCGPALPAMALVADGPQICPSDFSYVNGAISLPTTIVDASGEYIGIVFRAPKTGNLRTFQIHIQAAASTPKCDFQFETVGTDGFPTGTLFGTNTSKTAVATSTGWFAPGNFTADAAVVQGDLMAAVVRWNSGSTTISRSATNTTVMGFPYLVDNTGTPQKSAQRWMDIGIQYDDGTYALVRNTFPASTTTTQTLFASGSNPNHIGNVYTPAAPKECVGMWVHTDNQNDYTGIIATDSWDGTADNDGTSNLSITVDKDQFTTANIVSFLLGSGAISFAAASKYRALYKPGASNITIYQIIVNASAILNQLECGTTLTWTQANNPTNSASWTDTNTQRAFVGFWFDKIDNGVSTGGYVPTIME